ncbi:4Fe-4S binding protein [Christensenellaceae bacterium OttesenSCG-928-K19]|nr:4Fe-4S binding protein [Christensenellaceae bacterium OttesenSCG-928-K19]
MELLGEIRSLSIATVDEAGSPQVRIIDTLYYKGNLYFVTARGKEFYHQLIANSNIGIVGMTKDWRMIRINATIKPAPREYVDIIFDHFKGINDVYPGDKRRILDAFCVQSGYGELFDLGDTPIYRKSFAFGGACAKEKGFLITKDCISCGTCAQSCPQDCIEEGTPYKIHQHNCLHCGLCREVCPAGAVSIL